MPEILYFVLLCGWVVVLAWNFKKAVIILPAFFPLYLLKFQVGFVPFNVIEVMVYLTAFWMFGLFLYKRFSKENNSLLGKIKRVFLGDGKILKDVKKSFFRLVMPAGALVLGALGGLYLAYLYGDLMPALGIFKGWVLMPILYGIIVVRNLRTPEDRRRTLYFYMLSCLVLSFWALYQVILRDYITIDQRASGPFESANYLALYIAPAFVLACVSLWQKMEIFFFGEIEVEGLVKNLWKKFVGLFKKEKIVETVRLPVAYEVIVFGATGLALVAAKSYGGLLGVLGALFLYTIYELFFSDFKEKYGSIWKKATVFVVIIFMAVTAVIAQIGTTKFDDFLAFERQSSSSVRMQTWTVALKLVEENPFLGVGLGRFQSVYEERASEILGQAPYEKTMLHPHNLLLSTWMNSGLIGVIALVWLIVAVFWTLKDKKLTYENRRFFAVVLAMFIVVCLHGIIDQQFWKNDLALLWWLLVGLVI